MPIEQRDQIDEHSGSWDAVFVPAPLVTSSTSGGVRDFSVRSSYTLRNLRAGAVYDVVIKAKNKFGFSEYSEIFNFYNKGVGELDCFFTQQTNQKKYL